MLFSYCSASTQKPSRLPVGTSVPAGDKDGLAVGISVGAAENSGPGGAVEEPTPQRNTAKTNTTLAEAQDVMCKPCSKQQGSDSSVYHLKHFPPAPNLNFQFHPLQPLFRALLISHHLSSVPARRAAESPPAPHPLRTPAQAMLRASPPSDMWGPQGRGTAATKRAAAEGTAPG